MRGALLVLLLSVAVAAAAPPPSSDPVAALIRAPSFCMGCEAYAGDLISGDEAFSVILRRKTAAADLQKIFERGNREGQLYALAGLREIDRRRFEQACARFHADYGSVIVVLTHHPSSVLHGSTAEILRSIRAGSYSGMVRVMQKPRRLKHLPKLRTGENIERFIMGRAPRMKPSQTI
jgi:hypothetical protein